MTNPEAKATEDGVQQALDVAAAHINRIAQEYEAGALGLPQFDETKKYASLAESYLLVWRALHKLDAAEILAGKEDVR